MDDGSIDDTGAIAAEYAFRLIRTPNQGLSRARNVGLEATTGEIIAYTDGDARPDPHWLMYLAAEFEATSHAGVGRWTIAPPGDGRIADCVANAPGGPVHVLLSDREAEHIPGCSMAFRVGALKAIGGFDPQFRAAGDDVDVCWRLQERGWTLGFSHGAMVWHHHRDSIGAYWRQQHGYSQAEAMLERKWPEKYNVVGHLSWSGRLYGRGLTLPIGTTGRVYQSGHLGPRPLPGARGYSAGRATGVAAHAGVAPGDRDSRHRVPDRTGVAAAPPGSAAVCTGLGGAGRSSVDKCRGPVIGKIRFGRGCLAARVTVAFLHLLQPLARLRGRLKHGLTLWRKRGPEGMSWPLPRALPTCVTPWQPPEARLAHSTRHCDPPAPWCCTAMPGTRGTWRCAAASVVPASSWLSKIAVRYATGAVEGVAPLRSTRVGARADLHIVCRAGRLRRRLIRGRRVRSARIRSDVRICPGVWCYHACRPACGRLVRAPGRRTSGACACPEAGAHA